MSHDREADLLAEVTELRAMLSAMESRLVAVEDDRQHSRQQRASHHQTIGNLADLMLAFGERVGKVERSVDTLTRRADAQEELDRLRHNELVAMLSVAARDGTAKGERLATAETGLAKVAKAVGLSTTVITVVGLFLNFLSQHVWRLDRYARNPSNPAMAASAPAASPGASPVPGRPVDGQHHADP